MSPDNFTHLSLNYSKIIILLIRTWKNMLYTSIEMMPFVCFWRHHVAKTKNQQLVFHTLESMNHV